MPTISSFKSIENKYDVYRGTGGIKKFHEFLKEHYMKITKFKKKEKTINKPATEILLKCRKLL